MTVCREVVLVNSSRDFHGESLPDVTQVKDSHTSAVISRVLDAGQCNDSYSIAWYEQKAVCVLLALIALGFKGVRVGPTLPVFVSDTVKATTDVKSDLAAIVG